MFFLFQIHWLLCMFGKVSQATMIIRTVCSWERISVWPTFRLTHGLKPGRFTSEGTTSPCWCLCPSKTCRNALNWIWAWISSSRLILALSGFPKTGTTWFEWEHVDWNHWRHVAGHTNSERTLPHGKLFGRSQWGHVERSTWVRRTLVNIKSDKCSETSRICDSSIYSTTS